MKKFISIILISIILVFSFTACKADEAEAYVADITMFEQMVADIHMSPVQAENALIAMEYSPEAIAIIMKHAKVNWNAEALIVAQYELDMFPLSKLGLKRNLEDHGWTEEQAEYAANTIQVDWSQQALYAAMEYISQGMTKEQVEAQLGQDGFTGPEWNYVLAQHYNLLEGQ